MDEIAIKQKLSDSLKLIAACFYEPEIKLFEEEKILQNLSHLLESICPEASISVNNMLHILQNSDQEDLQVAHAELFVGPFELKASPYGSTYLEKERMVMGDSTMEVLDHYRRAGLKVDIKEPPDHIAIELEYLSYFSALEAEALQNGDLKKAAELQAEQKLFLGTYMLPWMAQLVQNIRSGTENKFYLHFADCFEKFLGQLEIINKPTNIYEQDGVKVYADATIY